MSQGVIIVSMKWRAKNQKKGNIGEKKTLEILRKLPSERFRVSDGMLFKYNGRSVQIDSFVISENAVFIVETKNIGGFIEGDMADRHWWQEQATRHNKLYNPLMQASGQGKFVQEVLSKHNKLNINIVPLVVFSNDSIIQVTGNVKPITKFYTLVETLIEYDKMVFDKMKTNPRAVKYDIDRVLEAMREHDCTTNGEVKSHNNYAYAVAQKRKKASYLGSS